MSENSILEDTQRTQGHEALRKNVAAGLALAGAVRSTLGPKGLDKLLVDNQGRTMVTNDGVTVLRTAKVEHPIAKMIISASETQEKSVSDGTTSTVILCAELLRNAWYLVSQGVHPSVVSRGYSMAENHAMGELHSLKLEASSMEVVRTVLEGKLDTESRELLSKLAVEAADNIYDEVSNKSDSTRVKKLQLIGNSVSGTKLISGLMVAKTCVHPEMNANLSNGNILLIDGGIERESLTSDVKIKVESTGVLEAFRKQEISRLENIVEKIKDHGIQLVVCRDGIDDEAREYLYRNGILAYRRVEKNDLDLISQSTGASLINDVFSMRKEDIGKFTSTKQEQIGGVNYWILESQGKGSTFVATGTTDEVVAEVERCFDDAFGVACQMRTDPSVLPGAGAVYIALARSMRRFAETIPGREQLAIEAWADALEIIPRALAENAGMDPTDSILSLTSSQSKMGSTIGINHENKSFDCSVKRKVYDLFSVVSQIITGGNEAAISVLRIDDILWAQQDAEIPEDVQERLENPMA